MNRSLCLTECSQPISWVSVGISRNVRHAFRGVFCVYFVGVRHAFAIRWDTFGNPFAAKWQTVSSRRGPIYRARIYVYTHEMENGYVRVIK